MVLGEETKGRSFEDNWGAPAGAFLELRLLPHKLAATAFRRRSLSNTLADNRATDAGGQMKRSLTTWSFASMGVGSIIATGIFSFLPLTYSEIAGPAVILSLLLASVTAACAAVCYCEFACELPVVGGGYAYVLHVFGELPAMLTAINLAIDYLFGTGVGSRLNRATQMNILHLTVFFRLVTRGAPVHNLFVIKALSPSLMTSGYVDPLALAIVFALSIGASLSTKAFSHGNVGLQFLHVGLVVFAIVAAFFVRSDANNFEPFFDERLGSPSTTLITGAANLFFIYIGFDVVALGAEEAATPTAVPRGMLSALAIVTVLYLLMAIALTHLISWTQVTSGGTIVCAYGYAFEMHGMHWARYIVALGACVGAFTSTGIGLYGFSRVLQVFARERLLPPFIGAVSPRFGTPLYATAISGLGVGLLAFFADFTILASMTSIGTLIMFLSVSLALLYRRYAPGVAEAAGGDGGGRHLLLRRLDPLARWLPDERSRCRLVGCWLFLVTAAPIVFCVFYNAGSAGATMQPFTKHLGRTDAGGAIVQVPIFYPSLSPTRRAAALIVAAAVWAAATLGLALTCPIAFVPAQWHLPAATLPWLPSCSVWLITMLLGGFGGYPSDYERVGYAVAAMVVLYLVFGVHASYHRSFGRSLPPAAGVGMAT